MQLLLKHVIRFAASLHSTQPFWTGKRNQLEAYLYNIGKPDLFLMFTVADYYWNSLQKYMPQYNEWKSGTAAERIKISRENVCNNPHIATYHFYRQFTLFMDKVVVPKFNVKDHWNHYEQQNCGTTHSHSFVWIEGGLSEENMKEADAREKFARFWGIHVVTLNPNPLLPPAEIPLIALPPHLQTNTEEHLTSILNHVQIHKCNDGYCLRRIKNPEDVGESDKKCRFYFPRELRDEAVVDNSMNPKHYIFSVTRNYNCVNNYNLLLTIA